MGLCASAPKDHNWKCECGWINTAPTSNELAARCNQCQAHNPNHTSPGHLDTKTVNPASLQHNDNDINRSTTNTNMSNQTNSESISVVTLNDDQKHQEKGSNTNTKSLTKQQKQKKQHKRQLSPGSKWLLIRGAQETPEKKIFADLGMSLQSHHRGQILHDSDQPLSITFTAPPRIDAIATLEHEKIIHVQVDQFEEQKELTKPQDRKEETEQKEETEHMGQKEHKEQTGQEKQQKQQKQQTDVAATKWEICECGVKVKQRPLAQKIILIVSFPRPGKYRLTTYCKEVGSSSSTSFSNGNNSTQTNDEEIAHEIACTFIIHTTKKTKTPEIKLIDNISTKSSPKRHKKATSFRATTLSRVDTAASPTGENLRKYKKNMFEEDLMKMTAAKEDDGTTINENQLAKARKKYGVSPMSHVQGEQVVHGTDQALTFTLRSPPRVECEAVLRIHKRVIGDKDQDQTTDQTTDQKSKSTFPIFVWERIKKGITLEPRPMANKVKISIKFPSIGRYEVRVFCKFADKNEKGNLILRYIVNVDQKTSKRITNSPHFRGNKIQKRRASSSGKSPGMHSSKKIIGSSSGRDTKISLWG